MAATAPSTIQSPIVATPSNKRDRATRERGPAGWRGQVGRYAARAEGPSRAHSQFGAVEFVPPYARKFFPCPEQNRLSRILNIGSGHRDADHRATRPGYAAT